VDSSLISPTVSVLMSVFNGERWLSESIQSVLDQTFTDFEFIIVNDGSADGSLGIINQFAAEDPRIQVFDKPNTGLADSLNYGIARANGEWIARIDADDICDRHRLLKQISLARSNAHLVLIGSGLKLLDENGIIGKTHTYPSDNNNLVRRLPCAKSFFPHSSAFFRTKTVKALGGYRTRIQRSQDRDLWLRLSEVGLLASHPECLVFIRKHHSQISHQENGRRQLIDSNVAMVSYWLRKLQSFDPVDATDPRAFDKFRFWVAEQLESGSVYQEARFVRDAKVRVQQSRSKIVRTYNLFMAPVLNPLGAFFWVLNKGRKCMPLRIAKKWILYTSKS